MVWYIVSKKITEREGEAPNLRRLRETDAWCKHLQFPRASPVSCLAWCPRGRYEIETRQALT